MYGKFQVVQAAYMADKRKGRSAPKPKHRVTYIRAWRESRGLSLEALAERVDTTHATLSRIERGLIPYSQPLLERIAEELNTDPASLLMRNPEDPEGLWSLWDQAKPGERAKIVGIAKTILDKTGS